MKTKKLLCAVLSFALVISTATGSLLTGSNVSAAKGTDKVLAYVAVENDTATGGAIEVAKTPVLLDANSTAMDALTTVLDTKGYKDNYVTDASYGGSLISIDGLGTVQVGNDWYYWNFGINGASSQVALGTYKLQNNDQISLVYTADYTNAECDCYQDSSANNPSTEQIEKLVDQATQQQKVLADKIFATQFENGKVVPGVDDLNGLYSVFSLLRAGYSSNETTAFYDAVYAKLVTQFADMKAGTPVVDTQGKEISFESILSSKSAAQSYAKIVLCVEALGKDPKNVGGVDLIEKLASKAVYDASSVYSRESMILFAIDAIDAELPEGTDYITRAELVNVILADVDNQIATSIDWDSLDSAAMAIQALAPYLSTSVEGVDASEVKTATDKVMGFLRNMQGSDASYGAGTYYPQGNVWTLAQVMITIGAFGISPTQDETYDFVKNGKTVFDAASVFVNTADGTVDEGLMGFQPEQLLRGLNACIRVEKGQKSLFDIRDNAAVPTQSPANSEKPQTTQSPLPGNTQSPSPSKTPEVTATKAPEKKISLKKPVISKIKADKKKLTVTFGKVKNAKKYVVEISTNKKFKKATKKTVKTTKVTIKKLSSKKKYYVRVRAINGKSKSAYSKVKSKKTK